MEALKEVLMSDRASFIFDTGFGVPVSKVNLAHIPRILTEAFIHFVVSPVAQELNQFEEGLKLYNILHLIRRYPRLLKCLFVLDTKCLPTSADMMDAFNICYSNEGSSDAMMEEDVAKNWFDFLEDVENGLIRK